MLIGVGIVNILARLFLTAWRHSTRCTVSTRFIGHLSFRRWRKLWPRGFENERVRWWAIVEAAHIGGSLAPLLTSACYRLWGGSWKMGFYVPGAISLLDGDSGAIYHYKIVLAC